MSSLFIALLRKLINKQLGIMHNAWFAKTRNNLKTRRNCIRVVVVDDIK